MVQARDQPKVKVAFTIFGGPEWTGGINYLKNILCAIQEIPGKPIKPILFHADDVKKETIDLLIPFLDSKPIAVPEWRKSRKHSIVQRVKLGSLLSDKLSERYFTKENIDLVFQSGKWYGFKFPIPTIAWIPDFQHKHMPHMFDRTTNLKRDLGYKALSYSATRILVSSEDARRDSEKFLPKSKGKISVLPFTVSPATSERSSPRNEILQKYPIPENFFYLPNQLWQHKNHLAAIEALNLLKQNGNSSVTIVATGNPRDFRNPGHPEKLLSLAKEYGLHKNFIFLGMIPYEDIEKLMTASIAVINPSLFEGWSTTVEEAKSIGAPLVLSDISVHREQAGELAEYFHPSDHITLAAILERKNSNPLNLAERDELVKNSILSYQKSRIEFSRQILEILNLTISTHK